MCRQCRTQCRLLCPLTNCHQTGNRSIVDSCATIVPSSQKYIFEVDGDFGSGTDHKPYCSQTLTNRGRCWSPFFFFASFLEFYVKGKAGEASEVSININIVWSPSVVTCTPSSSVRPLKIKSQAAGFPPSEMKVTEKTLQKVQSLYLCQVALMIAPPPLGIKSRLASIYFYVYINIFKYIIKIAFPKTTKEKSDIFVTSYYASTHICMQCMETMATTDHIILLKKKTCWNKWWSLNFWSDLKSVLSEECTCGIQGATVLCHHLFFFFCSAAPAHYAKGHYLGRSYISLADIIRGLEPQTPKDSHSEGSLRPKDQRSSTLTEFETHCRLLFRLRSH